MIDAYEVSKKLIGFIGPVGETQTDEIRFRNLERTADLVERLLIDMDNVVMDNKNSHESSRIRAVDFINKFFDKLGIKNS